MILDALNLQLHTSRQERIIVDDKLSVEHIWPQNPDPNCWPQNPDESVDFIHTLGNLTLVTPSFNSELSNKSFAEKRGAIAHESNLRLNSYFQRLADNDDWSEENIRERGEHLFEIACKVWPYPR